MYSSKRIELPARTWVNLNAASGIAVGTEIWLQNLHKTTSIWYQVSAAQPASQTEGWEVHCAGTPLSIQGIPAGRPNIWALCETDATINVQRG